MDKSVIPKENKASLKVQRIGIDTSVLVNLIIRDINIFKFREKEFSENDSLYYAIRTKYEFKGVIISRFGFDKKEKNKLWRGAKSALKLSPIKIGKGDISHYLDKVKEAKFIVEKNNYFIVSSGIGDEDIEIIANFLKWKISKVYTSDKAFYETCKVLGLKSVFIPISRYFQYKALR